MKKLLLTTLATSMLLLTSCDKDDDAPASQGDKLSKIVMSTTSEYDDVKEEGTITVKYIYNKNSYISKTLLEKNSQKTKKDDDGKLVTEKGTMKTETFYDYNAKNQLIKDTDYHFNEKGVKGEYPTTTEYTYDNDGFIVSETETYFNEKWDPKTRDNAKDSDGNIIMEKMTTKKTYEYKNGLMVKAIDNNNDKIYEYDKKGILTKSYEERFKNDYTSYTYDDKKNPIINMLPKEYRLIDPNSSGSHNVIKEVYTYKDSNNQTKTKETKHQNEYYDNGFLKTKTEKSNHEGDKYETEISFYY